MALLATVFLFCSFRGNGEDGLHLATSNNGVTWTALRGDTSFLKSTVGGKLMRDPCLRQAPDGTFHLVWTTGWTHDTLGYASSKDLLHWSEPKAVKVMAHEPTSRNVWAPELFYDEAQATWLIFWASTIPGRFPETDKSGDGGYNHRMYYTTTKDFATFAPTKLFYDGGFNVIDATMVKAGGKYHLIVKDETKTPVKKNLRIAVGDTPYGPFGPAGEPFTPSWVEGPTVLQAGDDYVCYFDCYTQHRYGALASKDLKTWTDLTPRLRFPRDTRHGTVLTVPTALVDALR